MADPGVRYNTAGGSNWTGIVTPTIITPHDFSETFDYIDWDGTDYWALAYQLTPTVSGKITIDTWLSSYPGYNETEGSTHPFPGSQLWAGSGVISGASTYSGSGISAGVDGQSDSMTITCTAGTPIKLYAIGGVWDSLGNDVPNEAIYLRLRTSDIVPTSSPHPSAGAWTPTVTWPGPSIRTVPSPLPGRRHFRPH